MLALGLCTRGPKSIRQASFHHIEFDILANFNMSLHRSIQNITIYIFIQATVRDLFLKNKDNSRFLSLTPMS